VAGEREAVAVIWSFLDSGAQEPDAEVQGAARYYADLCAKVNERLGQCELYLNQGMRTEAIHLAETQPPLMEAAAALHFRGAEAWREFCVEKGLPVPPLVAAEVVSRLNDAYMREDSLAALMTTYRRAVRQGTSREKIRLLRQLVKLEPENVHWREDLTELEKARHRELAEEVRSAITANDTKSLELLLREVESRSWSVAPPPDVTERLKRYLGGLRRKTALAKGRKIAEEVWAAYAALDFVSTQRALHKWRDLCDTGYFFPLAEMNAQVSEAAEWVHSELKKRAADRSFRKAVAALESALDRKLPLEQMEQYVYAVNQFSREIPEALRQRVERALNDARLSAQRQFRLKAAAIIILVAALVIPLFFFVRFARRQATRNEWIGRIDAARSAGDFQAAKGLLEQLRRRNPDLYGEALFQQRLLLVDKESTEFIKRHADFERAMKELEEIEAAGFPADRPTGILQRMAKRLAHTDKEKLRLADWRDALQEHQTRMQSKADANFIELVTQSASRLKKLSEMNPEAANGAYATVLESIDKDLRSVGALPNVSQSLKDQLPPLQQKYQVCAAKLKKARQRLAKKLLMLEKINQALPDLDKYQSGIKAFIKQFPAQPESARFADLLVACRFGRELTRSSNWPVNNDKVMITVAEGVLSFGDKANPWRDVMRHIAAWSRLSNSKVESLKSLQTLKNNWRFYTLYSFTCTDRQDPSKKQTRYYCRIAPKKTKKGVLEGRWYYKVIARVFTHEHQEEEKTFWTSRYDVSVADDPAANLAQHCKILRRVLRELQEADPLRMGAILLRRAEELRRNNTVDPVAKVVLMTSFLVEAREFLPEERGRIDKVITQLRRCNTNIYWLDSSPTKETRRQKKAIAEALGNVTEVAGMAGAATIEYRVYQECIRRRIACVGGVKIEGKDLRLDLPGNQPTEVWIATRNKKGECVVWIVAERRQSGGLVILPQMKKRLRAGQPLLAPKDGRRTSDILKSITKDVGNMSAIDWQAVPWPRSWPMNARRLNSAE